MPSFKTVTLGCKVNQYETQRAREGLVRLGFREVDQKLPADFCLVNTCTVTGEADLKSRKIIRKLARQNPHAEIVVMGCYATRAAEQVANLPGVVEVLTDKRQLPKLLEKMGLLDIPTGISSFGQRHRAYIKVQDGCRMTCAYCIIPKVRPRLESRPIDEVLDEVRRLLDAGYRELVLTGIHLGHYGVDRTDRVRLVDLLRRIVDVDGTFRLRLSSLEAVEVTSELIGLFEAYPERICPHLHLSMQSGSDAVLERMNRRWASEQFVERCEQIKASLDRPALTTDAIVGFPGETDADFDATCHIVEQIGFSKVHVFRFSPRETTAAAVMPDQVSAVEKNRRAVELAKLAEQLRSRYLESLIGRQLQILAESAVELRPGMIMGTSARYATVEFYGNLGKLGSLVKISAEQVSQGHLIGSLVSTQ